MSDTKHELLVRTLGPAADSVGETLQDVWEIVFGNLHVYAEKKALSRKADLAAFKEAIEKRILKIPPSEIKEPALSILGPTLEASKFYFEEPSLRDMFAACAAASLDKRKERELHPSFPEIIKQMSPADARNLVLFKTQLPVAKYYRTKRDRKWSVTVLTNVFLANKDEPDLELQSRSISSLARLGLIEIEYEKSVLKDSFYDVFHTNPYFVQLTERLKVTGEIPGVMKGRAFATPLGKAFMSVCL